MVPLLLLYTVGHLDVTLLNTLRRLIRNIMTKNYMGLDISTTTIGISLVSDGYELLHIEHYKPKKDVGLFEMLHEAKEYILSVMDKLKFDEVIIEDISEYMGGHSTSKTIIALTTINRIIGMSVYEYTNKPPIMMNVNTVRSIIRPKAYEGKLIKEDVPKAIEQIMNTPFPYVTKETKKGTVTMPESYDRADAIAVVLAYIFEKNHPRKKTSIVPQKKKKADKQPKKIRIK